MGFDLHLIPVLTVDCESDGFHVGVEGHGLETTKHHVVETDIAAELSDGGLDVEWRLDFEILDADLHLVVHVLVVKGLCWCYFRLLHFN